MNKQEQAAFIDAYCATICDAPREIVEAFITDYENGDDVDEYSDYCMSIVDALGMWHSAIRYQLTKGLKNED